jgi:hypothetical protein
MNDADISAEGKNENCAENVKDLDRSLGSVVKRFDETERRLERVLLLKSKATAGGKEEKQEGSRRVFTDDVISTIDIKSMPSTRIRFPVRIGVRFAANRMAIRISVR